MQNLFSVSQKSLCFSSFRLALSRIACVLLFLTSFTVFPLTSTQAQTAAQTAAQTEPRESSRTEVAILTFNIRNGRGLNGSEVHLNEPAEVIRQKKPDIVGIQELDFRTRRSGNRDIPAELGQLTNMTSAFAPAIDFDGGNYGIGVLFKTSTDSNTDSTSDSTTDSSDSSDSATQMIPLQIRSVPLPGAEERRVLQIVEFETFVLFNTHFSLTEQSQLESIPIIESERTKFMNQPGFQKPIFLCGDLNAQPNTETLRKLQEHWQILTPGAPTFPADTPNIQIDYVLTPIGTPIQVLETYVVPASQASDHRPVFIRVSFPTQP